MSQASENGHRGLDERLDALATWVDEIAERVRATELANGDEKAAKELRRAVEAVAKHDPKLESRLTNRIDVLADRHETLASAVSTTSAELARRDGQLAALQRELEQGHARIEALGRDVAGAAKVADVSKLREVIAEQAPERPVRGAEERLDRVEGKLGLLTERIDTLAPTVSTATAGLAARDGELANLRQKLDQVLAEVRADPRVSALAGRIDALAAGLDASTERHAARDGDVAALRARIDDTYEKTGAMISELQRSHTAVSARLGSIEELPATVARHLDAGRAAVQTQLDELAETVARIEQSESTDKSEQRMDELASRIDALATDLDETAQAVTARTRAAEQASTARAHETDVQVRALAATATSTADRLATFETLSSERIGQVTHALDSGNTSLQAQLDSVAAELERVAQPGPDDKSERMLGELAVRLDLLATELARTSAATTDYESATIALRTRIDDAYQKASTVISELQLSLATLVSRVGALEALPARLDDALRTHVSELGARMEAVAGHADLLADLSARVSHATESRSGAGDEVERILDIWASDRASLELRLEEIAEASRHTGTDQELARLHRLLEGLQARLAVVSSETPATGDGRFRLELRALELRIEQMEKNASEDSEALRTHRERLATRTEWRVPGPEPEPADPPDDEPTPAGAQVVPFRGAEV